MEISESSTLKQKPQMDYNFAIKAYRHKIRQLQKAIDEKIKEVEDITAEKDDLESTIQSVLHKLWSKEEQMHNERETSYKREQSLVDALKQEKARCEKLECLAQSLRDEKLTLHERVCQMEYQILIGKEETERWKRKSEEKQSEMDHTPLFEGFMKQLLDLLKVQNKRKPRKVLPSSHTIKENSSESNSCDESEEGGEISEGGLEVTLGSPSNNEELREKLENLWHMMNVTEISESQPDIRSDKQLLQQIIQAFMETKTKAVDQEYQNARYLEKLQEAQEAVCLVEGKIQRLRVAFDLYGEENGEIGSSSTAGEPQNIESLVGKIESTIARNKSMSEENENLKRLNVSQGEMLATAQKEIDNLKREQVQTLMELKQKRVKIEEIKFTTSKAINDKNEELEIMTEQLRRMQKCFHHPKHRTQKESASSSNLLKTKGHELAVPQNSCDEKGMALEVELRELQENFERVIKSNTDLEEYCEILKEKVDNSETEISFVVEEERNLRELLRQEERKEEKLKAVMKELYLEVQTRRTEGASQVASITVLQEKVKCLEREIDIKRQELQLERKNAKNAKETEHYLQSSLDKALAEILQIKAFYEKSLAKHREYQDRDERGEQQKYLVEQLQDLENILHNTTEKSASEVKESADVVDKLTKENRLLRQEVSECNKSSAKVNKTNEKMKALLQAMKEDLIEEMRAKKEAMKKKQELEVFLQRKKEKAHELEDRFHSAVVTEARDVEDTAENIVHEEDHHGSPSETGMHLHGKVRPSKCKGKKKLMPKALSRHFSSSSVKSKVDLPEDCGAQTHHNHNEALVSENKQLRSSLDILKKELQYDMHVRAKMVEQQHRLRDVLMAIEHDKESLEREVEALNAQLQRKERDLETCQTLRSELSEQVQKNVGETTEIKKSLNVLIEKIRHIQTKISGDIPFLTESVNEKDLQIRNLERTNQEWVNENASLLQNVQNLTERLGDEVALKVVALEEGRQLRDSLQKIVETKEIMRVAQFEICTVDESASPRILPLKENNEVRIILQEVLGEIELFRDEEFGRLKERLSSVSEEINALRDENEHFKSLLQDGAGDGLQIAEETISYLTEKLKFSQEKQKVLKETCVQDRVRVNEELEKVYQRYTEVKFAMKRKEEALAKYEERQAAFMSDNCQRQEELNRPEKLEATLEIERWKRKHEKLQENFNKECQWMREENNWLHTQLAEESSICEETKICKARLDESLREAEEKLKKMNRELDEHRKARTSLEETRVVLETRIACFQSENSELKSELTKERSAALQSLEALRNEYQASAKHLKRQQQEENNLLTKVHLLEKDKKKLEAELKQEQHMMAASLETFTGERSGLTEKIRQLRMSLEEEISRRLELEEKMQQIVNISVMEMEQNQTKVGRESASLFQLTRLRVNAGFLFNS